MSLKDRRRDTGTNFLFNFPAISQQVAFLKSVHHKEIRVSHPKLKPYQEGNSKLIILNN
ncbi:hypothetical protein ACSBR2_017218 [Camellia fascicularis]